MSEKQKKEQGAGSKEQGDQSSVPLQPLEDQTAAGCVNCGELEAKYLRALADYQNLLKQTAKEKEEFARYANEQLLLAILPAYDNLKISLKHLDEAAAQGGWAEGIKYVVKQFHDALESVGLKEIKTEHHHFDHQKMEAVSEEETHEAKLAGQVAKEMSPGYTLHGKVIRAARVSVWKMKDKSELSGNSNES